MDELNAMLNQIMSDPESMKQIQSVAASLGLGGKAAPQTPSNPPPVQQNAGGSVDLSALTSLLGGFQQQPPPQVASNTPDLSSLSSILGMLKSQSATQPPPQQDMPDISALSGLLGNLTGNKQQTATGTPDISALTALLNAGNPPSQPSPSGILPNIDLSTILKLSQALASIQSNRTNIDLLLALKPRLKEERAKKIDDAIRVMQLIQFLPLIKESGIFGEMDKILGGSAGGGLGGLLGNVGNGIGGLLGGLGRR